MFNRVYCIAYYQRDSQRPNYTEAFVTVRIIPLTWPKGDCPSGYLFTHWNSYHIFVDSYEIVPQKSSRNWEDYFNVDLQGANHLIISSTCNRNLFLNLPELILDVPEQFKGY